MSSAQERRSGGTTSLSIVHLNAYDRHGGAERLVADLIAEQRSRGHRSLALVGHKTSPESLAIAFDTDADLDLRKALQGKGWPDYEFRGSQRLVRHPLVQQADVIHAHNLYGGYFHPFSLIALSHVRPVVWSIHDMQPLTGYCSHALECERWEHGCGECPDLARPGPRMEIDNTAALWRDKRLIAQNSRLSVVGASTWMMSKLQRSLLNCHPLHLIPNGIDTALFRPIDRREARAQLGLPQSALIIGSLARGGVLAHPWKGGNHVRAVCEAIRPEHPEMLFLNIGSAEEETESWIQPTAPESPEQLCLTLSALDIFLYPTRADTAPLSVLEAMSCGLPVVAFQVGGLTDFVTEHDGILVEAEDTAALIAATRTLADDYALRARLGRAARERAVAKFDRTQMAEAYERLYRDAMPESSGERASFETSALEELRLAQAQLIRSETKASELRARRTKEEKHVDELLRNRWIRAGLRLGILRGAVRHWLQLKERERARQRQ